MAVPEEYRPSIADMEVFGLSERVVNMLEEKLGILYADELLGMDEARLLGLRGFGKRRIREVLEAIANLKAGNVVKTPRECLVFE